MFKLLIILFIIKMCARNNIFQKFLLKPKPAAHLEQNIDHCFTWRILCNAPSNPRTRKNIEAFFIAIMRPSLNEQTNSDALILFRNGVT